MDQLIANVDQPNLDAAGAAKALTELKLALLDAQNAAAFGARALEAACGLSVRQKDKVALERALTQLMPYYGKTPNYEFVALRLLFFLVESRLMDFFAALELLNIQERTEQPHVRFVVNLERHLTEGGYNKALRARAEATSPLFAWLLEDFENTVRDHVATCVEAAFPKIGLRHAAELLNLPSTQAVTAFGATREGWILNGDVITFAKTSDVHRALTKEAIPATTMIQECIGLSMELDRIV